MIFFNFLHYYCMKLGYIKFNNINNINLNNNKDRHTKFTQNFHRKDSYDSRLCTVNKN